MSTPQLVAASGGAWIVHLGTSSDDAARELESLCDDLEARLQSHARPVHLFGGMYLDDAFTAQDDAWTTIPALLIWTIARDCLADWAARPGGMQQMLRRLHSIGRTRYPHRPDLQVLLFVTGAGSFEVEAIVRLIAGLGISVRVPADTGDVLVEVVRPDGRFTGCVGEPFLREPGHVDPYPAQVQRAIDRAESRRDDEHLGALLREEHEHLARVLPAARRRPPMRAPRMRAAILATRDGGAREALHAELRAREQPFALIAGPDGGIGLSHWPGIGPALPVFSDLDSLFLTAEQTGRPGGIHVAEMPPAKLFAWAHANGMKVLLNAFADPEQPIYLPLHADELASLAAHA